VAGRREREELVRENQVAPVVSRAVGRDHSGPAGGIELHQPRLLKNPDTIKAELITRAREEGFDAVGIAHPDSIPDAASHLHKWIAEQRHGDMTWMEMHAARREHPHSLWNGAGSVVMFGLNYGPDRDPREILKEKMRGAISVYAQGDDYHELIKGKLKRLGQWFAHKTGEELKVFVDTAPLMEKPLAQAAGLGWQGKHTNLVSREHGSWLFLGAMLVAAELPLDEHEIDHCGSCRACLDVCPTNAFPAPYQLDARRCISYLTIEHKGPIPRELRKAIGNHIYGCDDCLAACPWNKFASQSREQKLAAREENRAPSLSELAALDDTAFRARFSKSPIKRSGRERFVRNVLIAIGNSESPSLAPDVIARLNDESPLVRGAAVWAASRLLSAKDFAALKEEKASGETDEVVSAEWRSA
jgi:epoxyqueuosine reductase